MLFTIVGRDNDVSKGPTSFWTSQSIVCIDAQSCETAASSAWRRERSSQITMLGIQWSLLICAVLVSCPLPSNSISCSPGLLMSVRKPSQPLGFSVWIENNIIDGLKEEQRHLDNALFTNSMQARETNIYMDYAAKLLSEGLLDVYDLDIVYARRFAAHATDLYTIPFFKELAKGLDRSLLKAYSSSDEKKLIAFPWTKNQGILLYRKDLLIKHGYDQLEPLQDSFTWERMEEIASDIISKEDNKIQGYAWQGKAYEGLTCNFMEWIASDGVESRIIDGEKITFDQESIDLASHSLERVARWLEKKITLPSVSSSTEIIGRDDFVNGKTLFFRYVRYKSMLLTLFKVLTGHLLFH